GRRVTDGKSMEVTSMVLNGLVNTQVLGICRELDIAAVGVSGLDAGLGRARKRPPVLVEGQGVGFGCVGDVDLSGVDVMAQVLNGLVNTQIVGICRELDIAAGGVSGVDAGLVRAHKRPPVQVEGQIVDYGFVGDIDLIDAKVLQQLLDDGLMPVVSPVSADDQGTLLNINADTVAAGLGAALKAEKLMLCTGAPGILESLDDPRSIVSYTDLVGLQKLKDQGSLKDGMLPKAKAIEEAIRGGVRRVHVISYKSPDSILAEVFTNEGTGTLVVENISALSPAEQQAGG